VCYVEVVIKLVVRSAKMYLFDIDIDAEFDQSYIAYP